MSSTLSPNMSLPVPTVGDQPGPDYAFNINASLTLIDSHDHTPGKGARITPAAMNITSDLSFNNFSATSLASTVFNTQPSILTLQSIYVKGVDLYYRDGDDNEIQLTISGNPAGGGGSITGLPDGTAGVNYSAGVFTFSSATNTPADIQSGSISLGNNTALSKYLTLAPPNAMAADYTLTLPVIPSGNEFLLIDNTGAITTGALTDNSTIEFNANVLRVKPGGIGPTQLSTDAQYVWKTSTLSTPRLTFTITSASATAGATYTNNGATFTVINTIASGVSILMDAGGVPAASGTLTKSSGTGDTTITFSASAVATVSFVVPTNVTELFAVLVGGGGGGGGGRPTSGGVTAGGGGGGGEGSVGNLKQPFIIPVTPAETLTITIGVGGRGGGISATGVAGGATIIKRSSTTLVSMAGGLAGLTGSGGTGGNGGGAGGSAGISSGTGATGTLAFNPNLVPGSGGGGGGGGGTGSGGLGAPVSIFGFTGGTTGGASANRGGGGGGGASCFANGGNGTSVTIPPTIGTLGSGGGGGPGDTAGAAGGNGQIVFYYLGNP